jgi:Xaa-Pro aminopeptidase
MRDCELDAIVATSPANVAYVSGYRNRLEVETRRFMLDPGAGTGPAFSSLAVATRGGRAPALAAHALFAAGGAGLGARLYPFGRAELDYANGRISGNALARALKAAEWETAGDALAAALRDRGVDRGRIGVELAGLTGPDRRGLAAALPRAEVRDCTALFRILRAVKTQGEIELLREAGKAAERALQATLASAPGDATLDDLAARYRAHLAGEDADVDHLAFSPRGAGIALHSTETLRDEVAYLDYGCVRRLVRSDSGLTVALRRPERDLVARFEVLADAVAAGAGQLRPALPASAAWTAMQAEIDRTGLVSSPQGHGIGVEAREYPLVAAPGRRRIRDGCVDLPGDLELETRMVVNLEASTFLPGVASLHVERSFVIGPGGPEPLITDPLDRLLVLERAQPKKRRAS